MCDCPAHQYLGRECTCFCDHTGDQIPEKLHLTTVHESRKDYPQLAVQITKWWATEVHEVPEDTDFYVVWSCFILGGWKALVSSTAVDGRYYELTYNKDTDEVYIDTYVKHFNTAVTLDFIKEII